MRALSSGLLVALLLICSPLAGAQEAARVSGTSVSLVAPPEFAPASGFTGYMFEDAASSIMVNEIPAPVGDIAAGLTKERLSNNDKGMTFVDREELELDGHEAVIISVIQTAQGIAFDKQMLLLGDARTTVMVVASYPNEIAEQMAPVIREALLSVRWTPGARKSMTEGLNYAITESADMKIQSRMSNVLLLTHNGQPGPQHPGAPSFVATSGENRIPDGMTLEVAAQRRLMTTAGIAGISDLRARDGDLNGMPYYEMTASARSEKNDTPLRVYQFLGVRQDTIFLAYGVVKTEYADTYMPQFEAIAKSLRWKN